LIHLQEPIMRARQRNWTNAQWGNGGENLAMAKITHFDARTWRLT